VDDLLAAVKQLPPSDLRKFRLEFAAWSGQKPKSHEGSFGGTSDEALLACIRENSTLPTGDQRLFNRLRRKRQAETLTASEEQRLQALWRRVERMNVARLEALAEMSGRRGMDIRTLMQLLGLAENRDAF